MNIKKSIEHFMYELRLNASQLAAKSGMSPPSFSKIRNGTTVPTIPTIIKLADACDVKISEFIAAGE